MSYGIYFKQLLSERYTFNINPEVIIQNEGYDGCTKGYTEATRNICKW